jgi:hypothetical protein
VQLSAIRIGHGEQIRRYHIGMNVNKIMRVVDVVPWITYPTLPISAGCVSIRRSELSLSRDYRGSFLT